MKRVLRGACATLLGAGSVWSMQSALAADFVTNRADKSPQAARIWSDAEFAAARPMLPKVSHLPAAVFDLNAAIANSATQGPSVSAKGNRGGADARSLRQQRPVSQLSSAAGTDVADAVDAADDGGDIGTQAVGSLGRHFTSTRTFPNSSDTTYPTRTVGKLYFRDPATNTNYVCSASMIQRGVVLTSGHCVHDGASHFYTDFVFRPGLRNGVYPYGTWSNWTQARTTASWRGGGGSVPNVGDWATIVFGPNASGLRIGQYTGWLGYTTNFCSGKHLTTLGYPVNLDSGLQMQKSDSQSASYGSLNNCTWGTDMRGGSSGGPIVLNLEVVSTNSSPAPLQNNPNRAVSTVSWGYISTSPHVQGGSIFNNEFVTLLSNTCSANPGACI